MKKSKEIKEEPTPPKVETPSKKKRFYEIVQVRPTYFIYRLPDGSLGNEYKTEQYRDVRVGDMFIVEV